jgi:predicted O-linked N-acetylglucosamine transferase (SPINDLY family)
MSSYLKQKSLQNSQSSKLKNIIKEIQKRNFCEAINLVDIVLKKNSSDIDALYLKAQALLESTQHQAAKETFKTILLIKPNHLNSLMELAQLEADDNNLTEAILLGEAALKLDCKNLQIKLFLIGTHIIKKEFEEARNLIQGILKDEPNNEIALYLLAMSFFKENNHLDGYQYALEALKINPKLKNLRLFLAEYYEKHEQRFNLAIKLLKEEMTLNPSSQEVYKALGYNYSKIGEIEKAIEFTKHQIKLNPQSYLSHCNLIFFLPYSPKTTNQEILDAANDFYQKCFAFKSSHPKVFINNKDHNKKLKIGFVSGDFKHHALFYWLKGFFKELQKFNCEVYCYCNNEEDEITKSWKLEANLWKNILYVTDLEAYDQIQKDEIDILIDLSGHTHRNRLGIFALKPAPIQITWLGQDGPLGLPEIDYMISDNYMVEPGEERFYNEKILRLPDIYAPYVNKNNLEINNAPCLTNNYVTFGCLNNFIKINREVIDVWIKILSQVQDSRLILKSHLFADHEARDNLKNYFLEHKISKDRLIFEPFDKIHENYLKTYLNIDIALDPFPFGGATTTADILSTGIPLITLYGCRQANRSTASMLNTLGLQELIAFSKEDYQNLAIKLAGNYSTIQNYRENIRKKYLASPLNNLESFAKNFSNTLKAIWQDYCLKE